jgi:hypothetical protein
MSHADLNPYPDAAKYRRRPEEVMRLARMGSFHPTRLSFMRVLLRRLEKEGWTFERRVWEVDAMGVGHAVYTVQGPTRAYSLVAFAHDLPDDQRSDRVIATAWDATFALFDGVPRASDIHRLSENVPKQEAGRVSEKELSLSRANRSVRLFEHVVDRLSKGLQPDWDRIAEVGYLMRTTAVYGSGKFGAADRDRIAARPELSGPFQAEMLSVWLTRVFTVDIVEHLAKARGGGTAVALDPAFRRRLGVGNSTGLGMAPFLMNHPMLLNNWMLVREEALARVRSLSKVTAETLAAYRLALTDAQENATLWRSEDPRQIEKLTALRDDLNKLSGQGFASWNDLWLWGEAHLSLEGQEALVSLLLEAHGDAVDDLADCMDADEGKGFRIDGSLSLERFKAILDERYAWTDAIDFASAEANARFWYVSEAKLEPRLGERFEEPGGNLEQPLAVGRDIARLKTSLAEWTGGVRLADFLLAHPEHRHAARRALIAATHPFAEIQDNLIASDMVPIDLLRCKLSFFGASRFDPKSDRWVRISMYADAPTPESLLAPPA